MKNGLIGALGLAFFVAGLAQAGQEPPLNDKERRLADLVNQVRLENGRPPVEIGASLTKVARLHVGDLVRNKPDEGTDSRGEECNLHSWSNQGAWTPVCYTDDHQYASLMWGKPRELTSYSGNGYEIVHFSGMGTTPASAIASWKGSPDHLDVILERGTFTGHAWKAAGVGIEGNYACVWFGESEDPAGPVSAGAASPAPPPLTASDHPDVAGVGAGLFLSVVKPVFRANEPVAFVLKMVLPGSANLERCRYNIQIYADGRWQNYFQSRPSFFKDLTLSEGRAKTWEWDRMHEDGKHSARPGKYRIRFRAPRHTSDILAVEFELKD